MKLICDHELWFNIFLKLFLIQCVFSMRGGRFTIGKGFVKKLWIHGCWNLAYKGIPRNMELVEVYNFSHEIHWLPYKRNACYELTFVLLFTILMMMSFWICDWSHVYLDKSRHVRFHNVIHLEDIDASQHIDVDRFCLSYPW